MWDLISSILVSGRIFSPREYHRTKAMMSQIEASGWLCMEERPLAQVRNRLCPTSSDVPFITMAFLGICSSSLQRVCSALLHAVTNFDISEVVGSPPLGVYLAVSPSIPFHPPITSSYALRPKP